MQLFYEKSIQDKKNQTTHIEIMKNQIEIL